MPDLNAQGGGILAQTGARAQPGQEQPTATAPIGPDDGVASAESQDIYDRVVIAGMKILFEDEKSKEAVVSRLKAESNSPAKALADTVAMLMIQLDRQAEGQIPEDVIIPAATELLEQTAELAESLDLMPIDDAVLNHAAQLMMVSLGEEYGTEPEEIQQLMGSMSTGEMQQIEQEQGNFARKQPPQEAV